MKHQNIWNIMFREHLVHNCEILVFWIWQEKMEKTKRCKNGFKLFKIQEINYKKRWRTIQEMNSPNNGKENNHNKWLNNLITINAENICNSDGNLVRKHRRNYVQSILVIEVEPFYFGMTILHGKNGLDGNELVSITLPGKKPVYVYLFFKGLYGDDGGSNIFSKIYDD